MEIQVKEASIVRHPFNYVRHIEVYRSGNVKVYYLSLNCKRNSKRTLLLKQNIP